MLLWIFSYGGTAQIGKCEWEVKRGSVSEINF